MWNSENAEPGSVLAASTVHFSFCTFATPLKTPLHVNKLFTLLVCVLTLTKLSAQPCATAVAVGSASNAYTNVESSTNSVVVDNDLNTVIFIHRNNATSFGGHSGQLRYDISTNDGASWTNDAGVLNPLAVNGTNGARYPQVAIYNPSGNTNPNNAYLSYLAPTTAATFNGLVSGVRQLNGSGNTETYNQPASAQTFIPSSMCRGANGVEWAIDAVYNGSNITGFRIYKGVWNGSTDFVWSTNTTLSPAFNTAFSGSPQIGDATIAFDPTGQYGWVCILTHITPGPTNYAFYPVFYRTTDGGNTWSSAMQVDIGQFSCIAANITGGNVATCGFEGDLVVDVNGDPHFLTNICNGNNAYAIFFSSWHHMYDITWHAGIFNAMDIANVNAGRGTWGTAPNTATMDNQPMAARTADGTKVFFGWCDNSTYTLGQANQSANLFSRAYDVVTHMWTTVRDFTTCNVATNGLVRLPKMAAEVIEPSAGVYRMAVINASFTTNDPILTCNFRFLNNLDWATADFTTLQPSATVAVDQGSTWLLCPGSTLGLSVTGTYDQFAWSNGATTAATTINAPGTYVIGVRSGCTLGFDTIVVTGLSVTATTSASAICPGDSALLTVTGNALSYVWNPGTITNDSVMVTPASTTTYTVTSGGDGGCTYDQTVSVTVHPAANIVATVATSPVCEGSATQVSASGASTYNWQPIAASGATVTVAPVVNTTYTVTGTDANGCMDVDSVTVAVNLLPTISASATSVTVCSGDSTTLSANGANSYDWQPGALNGSSVNVAPSATTTFTVTGTDSNGCTNTDSVSIAVNPLPTVTMTSPIAIACLDDGSIALSGSGSPIGGVFSGTGVTDSSFIPMNAGTGTFVITYQYTDANGCSASSIDSIMVDPCLQVTGVDNRPINAYPNPFSNELTLQFPSAEQRVITIRSVTGQIVYSEQHTGTRFTLEANDWSTGMYFVTVTDSSGTQTIRVTKE